MIKADLNWLSTVLGVAPQGKDIDLSQPIGEISTDSRSIKSGQVFLAIKGPNFDGTKFVGQVAELGAVAAIVEHPVDADIIQFVVPDTLKALGELGKTVMATVAPKTIAITGSVGKTSVKEMCAAIMSLKGNVLATDGNFNNHIGVPLTLLRLEPQHEYAVIELGANHIGEIAYTTSLTRPHVAVLNNVAQAHLEGFGSLDGVVQAKGEIYEGLQENGLAVVNGDSAYKQIWLDKLAAQFETTPGKIVEFGLDDELLELPNGMTAKNIQLNKLGLATYTLCFQDQEIEINLAIPGYHNVKNSMAAAAACMHLGATLEDIKQGLSQMTGVKGRVNLKPVHDQLLVIDDTYNANVQSVKAAIDVLAGYEGHRLLVLGDMAELGADARDLHEEVGEWALQQRIHELFSFGVLSQNCSAVFEKRGHHFNSKQALVEKINERIDARLAQGNGPVTILVKGSRSAKMELVVQQLIDNNQKD